MINSIDELKKSKIELLHLLEEKQRRLCINDFHAFFRMAWSIIWQGTPFKDNWHYKVLCDELQYQIHRITEGIPKTYDLIFNLPVRTAKSSFTTIALTPWAWLVNPSIKFISGSCNEKLSYDHAVRSRRLIESDWYQAVFNPKWKFVGDQNIKSFYENNMGGYRIATSIGGSIGFGANVFIIDDPISREDALSDVKRSSANQWVRDTVSTRLNDQEVDLIVLVMQRLHEEDTTGDILSREGRKWKHFCFPGELSDNVKPLEYKSKYVNGVMFPARHGKDVLATLKLRLGSFTYASQINQSPMPVEGNLFKKQWWNYWVPESNGYAGINTTLADGTIHAADIVKLPTKFDNIIISGDLTFKGTEGSDRVSLQVWAVDGMKRFLVDQILGNMDFIETVKQCELLYSRHHDATVFLIEDKANGPAVMSVLNDKIPILKAVNPLGSKTSRIVDSSKAMSMLSQCEAGHLFIPHPAHASWVDDFVQEYAIFPKGKHDDQIDAGSQAINEITMAGDCGLYTASQFLQEAAYAM